MIHIALGAIQFNKDPIYVGLLAASATTDGDGGYVADGLAEGAYVLRTLVEILGEHGYAKALPRIRLEAPRYADGSIVDRALSESAFRDFEGVLGHFHVQTNKQDPGPAFQWERVLREARELARR